MKLTDEPRPFLEHLEDLRTTLVKCGVTVVATMLGSLFFVREILEILYWPLRRAGFEPKEMLQILGVSDPSSMTLQVAFFAGLIFSTPLMIFFISQFILPGLRENEIRLIWPAFLGGTLLFATGVLFCFFGILPQAIRFFYDMGTDLGFSTQWSVQNYISFVIQMLGGFGLAFELPLLILLLARLGLVDHRFLSTYRRHSIVAIVILAAIITPTSDILTLALMSLPMWLLYELCILICWWSDRKERLAAESAYDER